MDVIEARGLSVRAGRKTPLSGVDLSVSGGVVGLLGRNGAGKTSLLRTLCTAQPPGGGALRLFGCDVDDRSVLASVRSRVGYAPQAVTVLPHLQAIEQVQYAAWLKGMPSAHARSAAVAALEEVDLAEHAKVRSGRMSGGMLRRLGIAMALVAAPDLLLLDEPTAGLDPEQRHRFRGVVKARAQDTTVVLSTHLIEDVVGVCDRVVVVNSGRIVFDGDREAFASQATDEAPGDSVFERAFMALTGDSRV